MIGNRVEMKGIYIHDYLRHSSYDEMPGGDAWPSLTTETKSVQERWPFSRTHNPNPVSNADVSKLQSDNDKLRADMGTRDKAIADQKRMIDDLIARPPGLYTGSGGNGGNGGANGNGGSGGNVNVATDALKLTSKKSPLLGLDDAKRWQLSTALHDTARNSQGYVTCDAHVWGKPQSQSSAAFWSEFQPILYYSGWLIQGGPTQKKLFPDGITLSAATDKGDAFNCAFRLSELLEGMGVNPVTLRVNQVTPDLITCKGNCVEIVVGDVTRQ